MGDINQDDIDKMLAGDFGDEDDSASSEPETAPENEGPASQDDIDALFAAVGEAAPEPAPAPAPEPEPAEDDSAPASQGDIDALFASVGAAAPEPVVTEPAAAESAPAEQPAPEAAAGDSADLHELLDSLESQPLADIATDASAMEEAKVETVDMDELLSQISNSSPPPPPPPPAQPPQPQAPAPETPILDDIDIVAASDLAGAGAPHTQFVPQDLNVPPLSPPPSHTQLRNNLSVMSSAGEVEAMAGQISGMLGQLSEKAHRYMQAWITSDSEAKELRARLMSEEHLRASAHGEKEAVQKELELLRNKLSTLEGEKIGLEEARRTAEAGLQSQIRELESRVKIQDAEIESLKNELTRARTEATGVDIESRRARFEADRLKSTVESERMERLRIQRALENREKELQAMQAQASGQASSLFIDELHRLVRRLESELDARTSGAHEALRQLDRLEVGENMVPVASNVRAALMQAIGADDSADDALKSLGREAERVRGPQAIAPGKTEMLSFESALSTYNLVSALEVAGALLREVKATPGALMRRVYQSPALRRQEVSEHLVDLARLLEGLRTVQESADRARGSESGESEVFYVQMFDFLHNLVRLKIVNRLAGEIWRIFLDLRGRFSFVTSDKQWTDYRDGILNNKEAK